MRQNHRGMEAAEAAATAADTVTAVDTGLTDPPGASPVEPSPAGPAAALVPRNQIQVCGQP
jgi:hypothetical protein